MHEVPLSPVTAEGEEVGTPLTFSLRTSQVGRLIWYIIIAGGVLLAVMILRRIVLRVRTQPLAGGGVMSERDPGGAGRDASTELAALRHAR